MSFISTQNLPFGYLAFIKALHSKYRLEENKSPGETYRQAIGPPLSVRSDWKTPLIVKIRVAPIVGASHLFDKPLSTSNSLS